VSELWNEVAHISRTVMILYTVGIIKYAVGMAPIDILHFGNAKAFEIMSATMRMSVNHIFHYWTSWWPLFLAFRTQDYADLDFLSLVPIITAIVISTLVTGLRLVFASGFFILFLLQGLIRGPVLLVWARLVENEQPVFTLFFGGTAALGKAIETVLKQLT
jgi:hypothetical protein